MLGRDGCLNFFAGPTDKQFSAKMNFYDVHYNSTHVMGTTGGNTADMIESLELTASGRIDPAVMVTHIGVLDAAAETTLNLPKIPGRQKADLHTPDHAAYRADRSAGKGRGGCAVYRAG